MLLYPVRFSTHIGLIKCLLARQEVQAEQQDYENSTDQHCNTVTDGNVAASEVNGRSFSRILGQPLLAHLYVRTNVLWLTDKELGIVVSSNPEAKNVIRIAY